MNAEDKRLVAIVLVDCILVASAGDTVADRVSVTWRL
jgi:hypothetical protein